MENVITVSYKKEGEIAYQLFQYDEGIKIRVEDIPQEDGIVYSLEAVNVGDKRAEKLQEEEPGLWLINDELLSTGRDIRIYLYLTAPDFGKTERSWILRVIKRPKAIRYSKPGES